MKVLRHGEKENLDKNISDDSTAIRTWHYHGTHSVNGTYIMIGPKLK
jgi:hypothetical protein